jgi:hypothetical protein
VHRGLGVLVERVVAVAHHHGTGQPPNVFNQARLNCAAAATGHVGQHREE